MKTGNAILTAGARSALLGLALSMAGPASAHPAIEAQIRRLDERIAADPTDGELYLQRGELYRIHQDWELAEDDFRRAGELGAGDSIGFRLGRMQLEAERPAAARKSLDLFLKTHPDHAEALVARARALVLLDKPLAAARDFERALRLLADGGRPIPSYYLERARALVAAGEEHVDEALACLDEGLQRLGRPVTLEMYAIELELLAGRPEAGLKRLDRLAAQSQRKESWLVRRGEILEGAGRGDEARRAYASALEAITALPPSRRWNRAVQRLESQAQDALARLERPPATQTQTKEATEKGPEG